MKNFAYVNKEKDSPHFYHSNEEVQGDMNALMMYRPDFNIKVINVPPVSHEEVTNLLGYRLRSLYPGDPSETRFDYKLVTKDKKRYAILFITSGKNIEDYKALGAKLPLFLPYNIVETQLKKEARGECIYYFWDHDWIDILIFEDKLLVSSTAVKREKELFLDFLKLKNIIPREYQNYENIFLAPGENLGEVKEKAEEQFNDVESLHFRELEPIILEYNKKKESLFSNKRKSLNILSKLRPGLLLVVTLLLGGLLFNKHISSRQAYKNKLQMTQSQKMLRITEYNKYKAMVEELKGFYRKAPLDLYTLLSEVSQIIGREGVLNSLKVDGENQTFILKGTAPDASLFMNKFSTNANFKNVLLQDRTRNEQIRKDNFTITGEFNAYE